MTTIAAALERGLSWAVPATRTERSAALWSFGYFFALLAGYYVLRPLRDQMGIAGGVKNLPWMFTATFVTLIVVQPLYGALVARLPRARFIPVVYHFFVANLLLFWLLLTLGTEPVIVARVFFVWLSVFSLFAIAVFWSFIADLFSAEQGKRLFGFIGAGGTLGGLLGPLITIQLAKPLGSVNLLIAAAVLLELAVFCVWRLEHAAAVQFGTANPLHAEPQRIGGSAFAAFLELVRSPYLLGVALWVSLLSFGATIAYLAQANIVSAVIHDRDTQTRLFASIDLAVNSAQPADAVVHHRPSAQAFRHRHCRRRFAGGVCNRLCRAIFRADARRRRDGAGRPALDEFCRRQSGASGILHGAWA